MICQVLLAILCASEVYLSLGFFRKSKLAGVLTVGNAFRWMHCALMAYGWWLWDQHCQLATKFEMKSFQDYAVLQNPGGNARFFLTNTTTELNFLQFEWNLNKFLFSSAMYYYSVCGCCVILFVLRVLLSFEFQIHLGIITRTWNAAFQDMMHFVALVIAVFVGYAISGHLLFGHEVAFLSTIDQAIVSVFWIMLSLDPAGTGFYDQVRPHLLFLEEPDIWGRLGEHPFTDTVERGASFGSPACEPCGPSDETFEWADESCGALLDLPNLPLVLCDNRGHPADQHLPGYPG